MSIETSQYNKVKTIAKRINQASGSGIITLIDASQITDIPTGLNLISINTFVKNLKAYASIKSISEAALPNYLLEDSDTDKLYKTLDIEWNSPRKQLDLLISENSTNWELVGSISLLNPSGYPYRMYNLQDLYTDNLAIELGENGRLGIQVRDVGYGGLLSNDLITIHGSYLHEIIYEKPANSSGGVVVTNSKLIFNACTDYNWTVASASQVILPANTNRASLLIVNKTPDKAVYVNLGVTAITGKGILLIGKGSSFMLNSSTGIYQGAISAIAEESVELCGYECTE